jgi:hypothetical protein
MRVDKDDLELKPFLRRLLGRGLLVLALITGLAALISLGVRSSLQKKFATHLSQMVRNDLLMGNNSEVLKVLQQNIAENFTRITYLDHQNVFFVLEASPHGPGTLWNSKVRFPVCLREDARDCSAALVYEYSLAHYVPWILLLALGGLFIFLTVFWMFRQQVAAYYRVQLKSHKEAALGRLSARICHDLKLPSMIFQRAAYLEDPAQFMAMRPQLQSHLQRLHAMLEKLKRAELEGLLRSEARLLSQKDLQAFLASIAPTPQQLQLIMPAMVHLYLDHEKFERSVANLVLNAFQARARQVTVELRLIKQDLEVRVENDGPAMPQDVLRSFVDPHHHELQGLGLQIVKDTVHGHGGRVDLKSDGVQTRFVLLFPNAVLEGRDAGPETQAVLDGKADSGRSHVIWLDADLCEIALEYLAQEEREPFELTSRSEGLALARLVVSRHEANIDSAMDQGIPLIVAGAADDRSWIAALRMRLRLLRRLESTSLSRTQAANVQNTGHEYSVSFE